MTYSNICWDDSKFISFDHKTNHPTAAKKIVKKTLQYVASAEMKPLNIPRCL